MERFVRGDSSRSTEGSGLGTEHRPFPGGSAEREVLPFHRRRSVQGAGAFCTSVTAGSAAPTRSRRNNSRKLTLQKR